LKSVPRYGFIVFSMDVDLDWCAPAACSLPLVDQPARVAEWDVLFTEGVCEVSPVAGGVRFVVDRGAVSPAAVADLVDRESQCCSFFSFRLAIGDQTLTLDVTSDAEHRGVVDALSARAVALRASRQ
jgi:hypothetical protein